MGRITSTMRSRSAMNASIRSPGRTLVDGFADSPFTRTWPPSHNRVASGLVFTRRTAQSQRSTRVASVAGGSITVQASHGAAVAGPRVGRVGRRVGVGEHGPAAARATRPDPCCLRDEIWAAVLYTPLHPTFLVGAWWGLKA